MFLTKLWKKGLRPTAFLIVTGMPLLNMIFKEEAKMDLVKRGMPAAIELKIANVEIYIYGFVTETSKVINGNDKEKNIGEYLSAINSSTDN